MRLWSHATRSETFLDDLERIIRVLVLARLVALGQHDLLALQFLVRNVLEYVRNDVEPYPALVVARRDEPGRMTRVRRLEHLVARVRVLVPAAVRLQVHGRKLPGLAPILHARLQATRLLFGAHFEP